MERNKVKTTDNKYTVVDKLVKGDYIFKHYNGYIFKANDYPYNLRDGIANRNMLTGEVITIIPDKDTKDVIRMPIAPTLNIFSRERRNQFARSING